MSNKHDCSAGATFFLGGGDIPLGHLEAGVSEWGGAWGHGPPMLEEGGPEYHLAAPKFRGPRPTGLVFFTLENVLCLLFESAIPGGKKRNIDHIL